MCVPVAESCRLVLTVFCATELGEGGLQVSVAQLWEGSDLRGGDQETYPHNTLTEVGFSVMHNKQSYSSICGFHY